MAPSADFRVFDPRVEEKASGVKPRTYTKTWSYVVTPLSPGATGLPTVSFTYFDAESRRYKKIVAPPIALAVKRGEAQGAGAIAVAGDPRREVRALQRDIRFLKPLDSPLRQRTVPLYAQWWVWVVAAAWAVIQPLAWLTARKGGLAALFPGARRARVRRRTLAELDRVGKDGRDPASVLSGVARALVGFVAQRCGTPAEGLTYEDIESHLARRGVGSEMREETRAILELCDFGRFAPVSQREDGREGGTSLVQRARAAVESLDREIERNA